MSKFDFHTHHHRCGHANGDIEDYIQQARLNGLKMIGISDHSPFFGKAEDQAYPSVAMAKSSFASYIEEVLTLKEQYKDTIEVLLGIEADYIRRELSAYRQAFIDIPFDYIIGSVHYSGQVSIFNKKRWNDKSREEQIAQKENYLRLIQESAICGIYDILGHIDAMKAFHPAFSELPTPEEERLMEVIEASDVAIEINTSGKTKAVGGWYPSDRLLEMAFRHGVKVTFGSDAHHPQRVGDDWDEVRRRLYEIGYREWAIFRQRERLMVPISD